MKIRELDKDFIKRGIKYTQVEKNDEYVLYKCVNQECHDMYYELFKYRLAKPHPMDTGNWDMVELYPSTESFGVWAWCCTDRKGVIKMLEKHILRPKC